MEKFRHVKVMASSRNPGGKNLPEINEMWLIGRPETLRERTHESCAAPQVEAMDIVMRTRAEG